MIRLSALIVLSLTVNGYALSVDDCPSSLQRDTKLQVFNEKCYKFEFSETLDFVSAEQQCLKNGGNLVMIESKAENDFLRKKLHEEYNEQHASLWIGLRYNPNKDAYFYVDGRPLKYVDLDSNSYYHSGEKYCLAIKWSLASWDNFVCDNSSSHYKVTKFGYICQYETSTPSPGKQQCPVVHDDDNLIQILDDKCYYFSIDTKLSFEKAKTFCKGRGGKLTNAESEKIVEFLTSHLLHTYHQNDPFWFSYSPDWREKSNQCYVMDPENRVWYGFDCLSNKQTAKFICEFKINPSQNTLKQWLVSTAQSMSAGSATTPATYMAATSYCKDKLCNLDCGSKGYKYDPEVDCFICECII